MWKADSIECFLLQGNADYAVDPDYIEVGFLYPPERLKIFQPNNLGILPAVAAQISIADGNVSYKNYKGNAYVMSGEVEEKIRNLVKVIDWSQTLSSRAGEEIFFRPSLAQSMTWRFPFVRKLNVGESRA